MTNFVVHLLKLHINIILNKLYKLVLWKHSSLARKATNSEKAKRQQIQQKQQIQLTKQYG